jgi:hypothetical protein
MSCPQGSSPVSKELAQSLTGKPAVTILISSSAVRSRDIIAMKPTETASAVEIARRLVAVKFPPEEIAHKTRFIYETIIRQSPRIVVGNFAVAASTDLALMFDLYDSQFFAGQMSQLVRASGAPLEFNFSSRLTRSAGLTKRFAPRVRPGAPPSPASRYEICLSSTLLIQTFTDIERTIRVNGLICNDRLEAAQRVFEHELIHLMEMLVWGSSSCEVDRFKNLVWNYFAHTQTRHDLVTSHEHARVQFDVRVGDRVSFTFEGVRHTGVVNRITRRATVLVEDARGTVYNDGKSYLKYYIPLSMLEKD